MIEVTELIEVLKKYPKGYMITTHDYEPTLLVYDGEGAESREVDIIGVGD
jgi:hypothetical protein